jgi:hypothetical protein
MSWWQASSKMSSIFSSSSHFLQPSSTEVEPHKMSSALLSANSHDIGPKEVTKLTHSSSPSDFPATRYPSYVLRSAARGGSKTRTAPCGHRRVSPGYKDMSGCAKRIDRCLHLNRGGASWNHPALISKVAMVYVRSQDSYPGVQTPC